MFSKGASTEKITSDFKRMVQRLSSERSYKVIKMNGKHFTIKATDHYFAAIVMVYYRMTKKQSVNQAFNSAMAVVSMMAMETFDKRNVAVDLFKEAVKWHHTQLADDFATADKLLLSHWAVVNARVEILSDAGSKASA